MTRGNKARVYEGDCPEYDFIAPRAAYGYFHVLAFKSSASTKRICRDTLVIGDHVFVPGTQYTEFGSSKKTSAGFIHYRGEPIEFVGVIDESALFLSERLGSLKLTEYDECYFSWKFDLDLAVFISMTDRSAGRIMHMRE